MSPEAERRPARERAGRRAFGAVALAAIGLALAAPWVGDLARDARAARACRALFDSLAEDPARQERETALCEWQRRSPRALRSADTGGPWAAIAALEDAIRFAERAGIRPRGHDEALRDAHARLARHRVERAAAYASGGDVDDAIRELRGARRAAARSGRGDPVALAQVAARVAPVHVKARLDAAERELSAGRGAGARTALRAAAPFLEWAGEDEHARFASLDARSAAREATP